MKVVFGYQEVWDLVQNGLTPINDRATDEEKVTYKVKKRDYKPLFLIHQCMQNNLKRLKMLNHQRKHVDSMQKAYGGAEKVREVRLLQTVRGKPHEFNSNIQLKRKRKKNKKAPQCCLEKPHPDLHQ